MVDEQQVAVVTGGGGGLGSAICHRLAATRAHVCVVDIAQEPAAAVAGKIVANGLRASSHVCDVSSSAAVTALADEVGRTIGDPTVLSIVSPASPVRLVTARKR